MLGRAGEGNVNRQGRQMHVILGMFMICLAHMHRPDSNVANRYMKTLRCKGPLMLATEVNAGCGLLRTWGLPADESCCCNVSGAHEAEDLMQELRWEQCQVVITLHVCQLRIRWLLLHVCCPC